MSKCRSKDFITEKYGIKEDFVLYVGGFSPRKNIIGLIEAYSKLPNKLKESFKLVIIGRKGPSYTKYKNRADDLNISNNVIFTDFYSH